MSLNSFTKERFCPIGEHQPLESQPLLSSVSQNEPNRRGNVSPTCSPLIGLCLASKAAVLILSWTVFVGALQFTLSNLSLLSLVSGDLLPYKVVNLPSLFVIFYASLALLYLFYPLSGYFADVYCGRFRTIIASLALLLCILIILIPLSALYFLLNNLSSFWRIFLGSASMFCLLITIIGIAGYGANFIQFGLDQLLDTPSHHQALFVHWAKWCYDLMSVIVVFLYTYLEVCCDIDVALQFTSLSTSVFLLELVLSLLLIIGCWKHYWFYTEPAGHHNPYKIVIKVLNFARKHSYALQRSAFTYCDNERPSRLDFAKERFGGPFTTEQVEDVKTFLRIVMILLAIGPIFILDVPTSAVLMGVLGIHLGPNDLSNITVCKEWSWIVVNTGLLRHIISTLFLPVYAWVIFTLLQRRVPKIFWRLGVGIFIYFLGGMSIFLVDVVGHAQYQGNGTQCVIVFNADSYANIPSLGMHWAVYIPSNVLIGVGPTLVTVTIFEFISAQSPHSMKGLLLGAYFAITGLYQFISSVALVPFNFQINGQHPSHTGCLFGYFLFICLIALIGLVLFIVAARCYRYREREDRPYDQRFVIDIYSRYLNRVHNYGIYSDSES